MTVMFTGIGGPTPLGLAKSIKIAFPDARLVGVDGSPWATSLYHSEIFDVTHKIPLGRQPNYWEIMEGIINKEKVDFIFVVPETEILVWTKRQQEKNLPCVTLIQDHELASFCFDKLKIAHFLYDEGLTPLTMEFKPADLLKMDFPFWIRVKSGAGALGALKVNNKNDLDTWLALNGYRDDFIISEFLPGRNYACKLLFYGGKLIQHASAERIDYLLSAASPSGISGMSSRGKLLNRPDLVEKSAIALSKLSKKFEAELNGIFTVDFKENSDGVPMITEINIRHVSFNYAFTLGGLNLAETTLRHCLDLNPSMTPSTEFDEESYFIRGVDAPLRLIPNNLLKTNHNIH